MIFPRRHRQVPLIFFLLIEIIHSSSSDAQHPPAETSLEQLREENDLLIRRCCNMHARLAPASQISRCVSCSCRINCIEQRGKKQKLTTEEPQRVKRDIDLDDVTLFNPDDYTPGRMMDDLRPLDYDGIREDLDSYDDIEGVDPEADSEERAKKSSTASTSLFLTQLFARFRDDNDGGNLSTTMIRSFFNQATVDEMRTIEARERHECSLLMGNGGSCLSLSYLLRFHVSTITHHEDVKRAEIIIGEMLRQYRKQHIENSAISVSIYEIVELPQDRLQPITRRLLTSKEISMEESGTFVSISITDTLKLWIREHQNSSHLLQIQMKGSENDENNHDSSPPSNYEILEQNNEKQQEEILNQPLLVVYSNSPNKHGKVRHKEFQEFLRPHVPSSIPYGVGGLETARELFKTLKSKSRSKRSLSKNSIRSRRSSDPNHCHWEKMFVNFQAIGYDKWIRFPHGYQAGKCVGHCNAPFIRTDATRHSIIQYWMSEVSPKVHKKPCCVPIKLSPISVVYFEEDSIVFNKEYYGMKVDRCGCR